MTIHRKRDNPAPPGGIARDQLHPIADAVAVHDHDPARDVYRNPAPIDAAALAWIAQARPVQSRWRQWTVLSGAAESEAAQRAGARRAGPDRRPRHRLEG